MCRQQTETLDQAEKLAEQSKNIDLIIGGHTHSFLNEPVVVKNSVKKDVLISQVGFGAIKLGKIDFYFEYASVMLLYTLKQMQFGAQVILKILSHQDFLVDYVLREYLRTTYRIVTSK